MESSVLYKPCTKCYIVKDLNSFNKMIYRGPDVYTAWCKECISKYNKEYLKTKCVIVPEFKVCNTCNLEKSKKEYYVHKLYGLQSECKKCMLFRQKNSRSDNIHKIKETNRNSTRKVKLDCLLVYGIECECCGEPNIEFLSIDHVDKEIRNQEHLNMKGTGTKFYYWLRKNGFPKDVKLRTLCMNCNTSYGHYGYCPHKEDREWL